MLTWALTVPCYFYLATHTSHGRGLFSGVGPRLPHTYVPLHLLGGGNVYTRLPLASPALAHSSSDRRGRCYCRRWHRDSHFKLSCSNYTQRNFTFWIHVYVNKVSCTVYMYVSLIPRLPHSRMWTLKLCGRGESGIFPHVSSVKGREGIKRP